MQRGQRKTSDRNRGPGLADFTQFFRGYIKAWPLLLACLIGPLSKYFHLIPMYSSHENLATGIVSVYGFLFAAALFYYRPALLRKRLLTRLLPAILILLSAGSLFAYWIVLQNSIRQETDLARRLGVRSDQLASEQILSRTSLQSIPNGTPLLACYLVSFFGAESVLVILALNEYKKPRRSGASTRRS
jgi:hypothetical protein